MDSKIKFIVVFLSTYTVYWALFGPLDGISTMTPSGLGIPVSNVVLRSPTTPDCYQLSVTPNGTITTKWVPCNQ